jgi:hypothetical protein
MSHATLNGRINSHDFPINAYFEWGLTTSYGNTTSPATPFAKNSGSQDYSFVLQGLAADTYHYRAVVQYANGNKFGADQSFVTSGAADPEVIVVATNPDAFESGEIPGEFTIFRTGSTAAPLTVNFTITGTAVEGTNFQPIGVSVVIPIGQPSVPVAVTPINTFLIGTSLTVDLNLQESLDYDVGVPASDTVFIHLISANAPCSIFEAVSIPLDTLDFLPADSSDTVPCASWTSLDIGTFEWSYVGGAYEAFGSWDVVDNIGGVGMTTRIGYQYNDGVITLPAGLNKTPFPESTGFFGSEGAAVTDYDAVFGAGFVGDSFFVREPNGFANGFVYFTTPGDWSGLATFQLIQTQALISPQPTSLTLVGLSTYDDGRFAVTYVTDTSADLTFVDTAATVQTALNAMGSISTDGGVVCAGTLGAGMTITWNNNGVRATSLVNITTCNPGMISTLEVTQVGTGGQPQILTLTVKPLCSDYTVDIVLPEWDGILGDRDLTEPAQWWATDNNDPDNPTAITSNLQFMDSRVDLISGPTAPAAPASAADGGVGNVDAGSHTWQVAFVAPAGESAGGPASAPLVLGGAATVSLTSIPTGPVGTTARNIYRTLAGGSVYYFTATIADNVTTVFNDNNSDATIFNSGFGTVIKPQSCFWQLVVECVVSIGGFFNLSSVIWAGIKLTGDDPTGLYLTSPLYATNSGSYFMQCPVNTDGQVQSILLSGTF